MGLDPALIGSQADRIAHDAAWAAHSLVDAADASSATTNSSEEPSRPGISGWSTQTSQLSIDSPVERGHDVLDHFHAGVPAAEIGAARSRLEVGDRSRDPRASVEVRADEDDSRPAAAGRNSRFTSRPLQ